VSSDVAEMDAAFEAEWAEFKRLNARAEADGAPRCQCGRFIHLIYCGICGKALYSAAHGIPIFDAHDYHQRGGSLQAGQV